MELTSAHLRYLLAIYEVSQTHLDISSRSIAEKLGVTKPSVVRVMNLLMERGMIVKEYYGKIYLTDRGIFVAREVKHQLDEVLAHFPPVEEELTDEERFTAAATSTPASTHWLRNWPRWKSAGARAGKPAPRPECRWSASWATPMWANPA